MRLTFELAGILIDWHLTIGPTEVDEAGFEPYQDAGVTSSTAQQVGHVPWEDPGSLHQFEAPDDDRKRLGFGR